MGWNGDGRFDAALRDMWVGASTFDEFARATRPTRLRSELRLPDARMESASPPSPWTTAQELLVRRLTAPSGTPTTAHRSAAS